MLGGRSNRDIGIVCNCARSWVANDIHVRLNHVRSLNGTNWDQFFYLTIRWYVAFY